MQDIVDGELRIVVQDGNGVYHEAQFATTSAGVQVYYVDGSNVEVGNIAAFDGSRKNITLVFATSGLTIVDVLVANSMPEVVMYPSVLDQDVENAIMLFRVPMPRQAIVDGALEMYLESERWGDQYIYPDIAEQGYISIIAGSNAYFSTDVVQNSNSNLKIYKNSGWADPDTRFSQPNRLAWMEGYTLNDGIDGAELEGLPEGVNTLIMALISDSGEPDIANVLLSQSEGNIVRSFDTDLYESPVGLHFSGALSLQTIFKSYPKPENFTTIPLRLELVEGNYIALYPLYAMRKNSYISNSGTLRWLRTNNSSTYAAVGTPSPVTIPVQWL